MNVFEAGSLGGIAFSSNLALNRIVISIHSSFLGFVNQVCSMRSFEHPCGFEYQPLRAMQRRHAQFDPVQVAVLSPSIFDSAPCTAEFQRPTDHQFAHVCASSWKV